MVVAAREPLRRDVGRADPLPAPFRVAAHVSRLHRCVALPGVPPTWLDRLPPTFRARLQARCDIRPAVPILSNGQFLRVLMPPPEPARAIAGDRFNEGSSGFSVVPPEVGSLCVFRGRTAAWHSWWAAWPPAASGAATQAKGLGCPPPEATETHGVWWTGGYPKV